MLFNIIWFRGFPWQHWEAFQSPQRTMGSHLPNYPDNPTIKKSTSIMPVKSLFQLLSVKTSKGNLIQSTVRSHARVSKLLPSLSHTGRRFVLGHILNTQTLTKTDEKEKGALSNWRFCVGPYSLPSWATCGLQAMGWPPLQGKWLRKAPPLRLVRYRCEKEGGG